MWKRVKSKMRKESNGYKETLDPAVNNLLLTGIIPTFV
jgi:hypothetical protein